MRKMANGKIVRFIALLYGPNSNPKRSYLALQLVPLIVQEIKYLCKYQPTFRTNQITLFAIFPSVSI